MKPLQTLILSLAWAGLIWMIFSQAGEKQIPGTYALNVVYNVTVIVVAVILTLGVVTVAQKYLRVPPALSIPLIAVVIIALAAIEVFWLRDFIAQL